MATDDAENTTTISPDVAPLEIFDATRRVEFGVDLPEIEEKPLNPRSGSKALEIRRELTQEDKELSRWASSHSNSHLFVFTNARHTSKIIQCQLRTS